MKSKPKVLLTNEHLTRHFEDTFTLALTSIDVARNHIHAGKGFNLAGLLNGVGKSLEREEALEEKLASPVDLDDESSTTL